MASITATPGDRPLGPGVASQASARDRAAAVTDADPAPLGLVAFGITMLVWSAVNTDWIGSAAAPATLALAIAFGGLGMVLAGMWAFHRGETLSATAYTGYGTFWISLYLLLNFFLAPVAAAGGAGEVHTITGMFLFGWGLFSLYMVLASMAQTRTLSSWLFLLTLTFFALCIGDWAGSDLWHHIGGYLGIATAVAALDRPFAEACNAALGRKILPTF